MLDRDRGLYLAFVACTLVLGWAILGVSYLPMADLPQHAAQVAGWIRIAHGDAQLARVYELNWLTPDLAGYTLARIAAIFLPLPRALGVVVFVALAATPIVVARELRKQGGDPWWALALFPLGYTMVFYWGLFNFLVGLPLVPWFVGVARRSVAAPKKTLGLLVLGVLLLVSHVLLFAFASTAAVLSLICARAPSKRAWPILAPWPLAIAWLLVTRQHETLAQDPVRWHWEWMRLVQLPRELAGLSGGIEAVQLVCAVFLLLSPFMLGARLAAKLSRWAPALLAVLLFFVLPFSAFGNACLYPRFAALLVPLAWLALDRGPRVLAPRLRILVPILAMLALGSLGLRLRVFDEEARELDAVLAHMQPGRTALSLSYLPVSSLVAAPAFEHLPMWYEANGGGPTEPSFASRYPMLLRYRAGTPHLPVEYDPRTFRYDRDGRFDYYVVRAPVDLSERLFPAGSIQLIAHRGSYWLYER